MTRTERPIRKREADHIIQALEGGIVPRLGLGHLLVGRGLQVAEVVRRLEEVEDGRSDLMIWVGDFGSGKSFLLRTIEQLALRRNFITATVDLSPTRRFQASDGKGVALYQEVMRQLQSRQAGPGQALDHILKMWIRPMLEEGTDLEARILGTFSALPAGGLRYELGQAVLAYGRGLERAEEERKLQALRWMGGQIATKTEAKQALGIGRIVTDDNWTLLLENWADFFRAVGYSGWVVNFDELVNLYKLPRAQSRAQNYERLLNLYNDLKEGRVAGLFVNLAATRKTVFDERRGLVSYGALKSRLGVRHEALEDLVNTAATVQPLRPLSDEEIFTLLDKLQEIFQVAYPTCALFQEEEIAAYMQAQLNRPGAAEFLTPRAVIKDFLELLQLGRQHPERTLASLLDQRFGHLQRVEKDQDDHDDELIRIL